MVGIPISNQLDASMQEILRAYIDEIIQAVCIVHKSECEIDDVNMISSSRKKIRFKLATVFAMHDRSDCIVLQQRVAVSGVSAVNSVIICH